MWAGENSFARSSTPRRGSCDARSITLRRLSDGIGQSPARYCVSVSVRPSLSAISCSMALLVISLIFSFLIFALSCEVIWFLQPGQRNQSLSGREDAEFRSRLERMATGVTGRGPPGAVVCDSQREYGSSAWFGRSKIFCACFCRRAGPPSLCSLPGVCSADDSREGHRGARHAAGATGPLDQGLGRSRYGRPSGVCSSALKPRRRCFISDPLA